MTNSQPSADGFRPSHNLWRRIRNGLRLLTSALLRWLRRIPLLCIPILLRLVGTAMYWRHVTVRPVREYLAVPPAERRAYLDAQG